MSQVNFFMVDADERELLEMLRARGDTRMIAGRFHPTPAPALVDELPREERLIELVNLSLADPPLMRSRGEGGTYLFDSYKDPHIEWSRCRKENGALVDGRLFAKIGWLEQPEANAAFQKWYSALARWITRRYERTNKTWWVGPHAARWWREGNLLSFGGGPSARARSDGRLV